MADDPNMDEIDEVILSYTFFPTDDYDDEDEDAEVVKPFYEHENEYTRKARLAHEAERKAEKAGAEEKAAAETPKVEAPKQ